MEVVHRGKSSTALQLDQSGTGRMQLEVNSFLFFFAFQLLLKVATQRIPFTFRHHSPASCAHVPRQRVSHDLRPFAALELQ